MFILPGVDNGSKSRATSKVQPVATLPKSSGFFSFLPLLWVFTIFFITISIALQYQGIRIGLNPVVAVENIKMSVAGPVEATWWKKQKTLRLSSGSETTTCLNQRRIKPFRKWLGPKCSFYFRQKKSELSGCRDRLLSKSVLFFFRNLASSAS